MKFHRYINESTNEVDKINSIISSKCKSYLSVIRGMDALYRGITPKDSHYLEKSFDIKKVRKDRRPLGTAPDLFKKINNWLKNNGHNRRDESFMVISDFHQAEKFGSPCYVFPIGKLSYTWIKSEDFNYADDYTEWDTDLFDELFYGDNEDTRELRSKISSYFETDKNIKVAVKHKYEIWFNCDEYLYVDAIKFDWDKSRQVIRQR